MAVNGVTILDAKQKYISMLRNKEWKYTVDIDGKYPELVKNADIYGIINALENEAELHQYRCIAISSWKNTLELHQIYKYDNINNIKPSCLFFKRKNNNYWSLVVTRAKRPDEHKALGLSSINQCYVPLLIYVNTNNEIKSINLN